MFSRTVLAGLMAATFAAHAPHAMALGAADACTWKANFIASGAIIKVASKRPLLMDSTMVGKSVKRCDSKRVAALVRVA